MGEAEDAVSGDHSPDDRQGLSRSLRLVQAERLAERSRIADLARQNELLRRDILAAEKAREAGSKELLRVETEHREADREHRRLATVRDDLERALETTEEGRRAAIDQCESLRRELAAIRGERICSPPAVRLPDRIKHQAGPSFARRLMAHFMLRYARKAAKEGQLAEAELLYQALIVFKPRSFLFRKAAIMLEEQGYAQSAALLFREALAFNDSDEIARQGDG